MRKRYAQSFLRTLRKHPVLFQRVDQIPVDLLTRGVRTERSCHDDKIIPFFDLRYKQPESFSDPSLHPAPDNAVSHLFADGNAHFDIVRGHFVKHESLGGHAVALTVRVGKTAPLRKPVNSLHLSPNTYAEIFFLPFALLLFSTLLPLAVDIL